MVKKPVTQGNIKGNRNIEQIICCEDEKDEISNDDYEIYAVIINM